MNIFKKIEKILSFWNSYGGKLVKTLGLLLFISGCAVKVNTYYDEKVSFDDYQSFCWFTQCTFTIDGPEYLKKDSAAVEVFKLAIVEELERKGYNYDANDPDFLLHLHIVVEEQEGILSSPYSQGDPDQWQGSFPFEDWENRPYLYLKGSMIIDIADASESRMVWRSDAVEYLDITTDLSDSQLRNGVRKSLKDFPPK